MQVIPVIVGGLGALTKGDNLGDNLAKILGAPDLYLCQKISLLGSKKILQDVQKRCYVSRRYKQKQNLLKTSSISLENMPFSGEICTHRLDSGGEMNISLFLSLFPYPHTKIRVNINQRATEIGSHTSLPI